MTDNAYNGWSNWETWNVKLWLDNDQYLPFEGGPNGDAIREHIEESYGPEVTFGPLADAWGMYLQCVNWTEIYAAYVDEMETE
jgi:hypothetical protein